MHQFKYHSVGSVEEACGLLSEHGEEAKIICGGQSLVILLKEGMLFPSYLIDVKGLSELDYIKYDEKDGLRIGATTTHRSVEKSDEIRARLPILAEMEKTVASLAVRNWGTVGGSLAHADPASDLATTLLALGAKLTLTCAEGERVVEADNFFVDYFETTLRPDELLTEIHIPHHEKGRGHFYKFALRSTDLAAVNAAVYLMASPEDPWFCRDVRISMGSVGPTSLRSKRAEEVLRGQSVNDKLIAEAARLASEDAQPNSDINGSEEFKRDIVKVLVSRCINRALSYEMN